MGYNSVYKLVGAHFVADDDCVGHDSSSKKHILRKRFCTQKGCQYTIQKTSDIKDVFSSTSFNMSINFQLKLGNEFFRGVSSNHFSWVSRGCHVVFVIPPSPYYDRTGEVQSLTFPVIEMFVFFPEMKGTCQSG